MLWTFINKQLVVAVIAWMIAQIIKCIINMVVNHSFSWSVALGSGGMPSSHSATVCALACSMGLSYGFNSAYFGICFILAFIVMYDAMGVRRETGKQGKALNDILNAIRDLGHPLSSEETFKELVGHTPLQVIFGALLGIIIGFITYPL